MIKWSFLIVLNCFLIVPSKGFADVNVYSTQSECESSEGESCDFYMCDYIPEDAIYDDLCGEDFRKGWRAIPNDNRDDNKDDNKGQRPDLVNGTESGH